jgi:hypothetical protein
VLRREAPSLFSVNRTIFRIRDRQAHLPNPATGIGHRSPTRGRVVTTPFPLPGIRVLISDCAAPRTNSQVPSDLPVEQRELFRRVLTTLNACEIPYAVAGAFAPQLPSRVR